MWWCGVDGSGMAVGQDVDLGVECELGIWLVFILMALDMEDVDLERELLNEGVDGLYDVVVR